MGKRFYESFLIALQLSEVYFSQKGDAVFPSLDDKCEGQVKKCAQSFTAGK